MGFSRTEHEWRTRVAAIQAAAEILRDHDSLADAERHRFLDAIIEESARLCRTLERFPTGIGPLGL